LTLGGTDEVKARNTMKDIIKDALKRRSPCIIEGEPFVVMGNDGFDGSWFPSGSFPDAEKALDAAKKQRGEEHLRSSGREISTTFHVFTSDGLPVRHMPGNEPSVSQ
jgi:hypothetical protein